MSAPPSHPTGRPGWLDRHATAVDVMVALVVLAIGAVGRRPDPNGTALIFSAGLALPLLLRRRWPLGVFLVIAGVAFLQWLSDLRLLADVSLLVALYTVAADQPRRRLLLAAAVLAIGILLAADQWSVGTPGPLIVFLGGLATAAAVLGINVRTRRAYLASVEERAAQLERDRDQQGRLAAAAERARIAREMHDIVAHNLSVMIALADGAGLMAPSDPERSSGAMDQVARVGRHALGDMRRLLGVLRSEEVVALAPQPGLPELDALIEQVRAAGLPVTLETSGERVPLGAGAELTVYRLVQEALTNTLKHAGPAVQATVRLRYVGVGVDVEVTDDGAGGVLAAGGQGLSGMRERAAVYGGAVEAGPRASGGWRVHARVGAGT